MSDSIKQNAIKFENFTQNSRFGICKAERKPRQCLHNYWRLKRKYRKKGKYDILNNRILHEDN